MKFHHLALMKHARQALISVRNVLLWNSDFKLKETNRIFHVIRNKASRWTALTTKDGSANYCSFMKPTYLSRAKSLLFTVTCTQE